MDGKLSKKAELKAKGVEPLRKRISVLEVLLNEAREDLKRLLLEQHLTSLDLKIKFLRTSLGMSQRELAQVFNISNTAVGGWESGKSVPNAKHLIALKKLAEDNGLDLIFTLHPAK